MKTTSTLSWLVPTSFQFEEAKRELAKALPPAAIVRLVLSVFIIIALAAHYLPKYIPDLEFDWTSALLKCLGLLIAILASCVLIVMLPPQVQVTRKGIFVSQGQSRARFAYAELAELRIEDRDTNPTLVLRPRDRPAVRRYAISPRVDLNALKEILDTHGPKQ
jgi:hypothetical protein